MDKSVRDLDQFKPGDGVQVSYTQEIIAMAENSDEGTARVAKYGTVDVEPEGDKPALVIVVRYGRRVPLRLARSGDLVTAAHRNGAYVFCLGLTYLRNRYS